VGSLVVDGLLVDGDLGNGDFRLFGRSERLEELLDDVGSSLLRLDLWDSLGWFRLWLLLDDDFVDLIVDREGRFGLADVHQSRIGQVGLGVYYYKFRILFGLQYLVDLLQLGDDLCFPVAVLLLLPASALRLEDGQVEVLISR
jgi:hypothetical protein